MRERPQAGLHAGRVVLAQGTGKGGTGGTWGGQAGAPLCPQSEALLSGCGAQVLASFPFRSDHFHKRLPEEGGGEESCGASMGRGAGRSQSRSAREGRLVPQPVPCSGVGQAAPGGAAGALLIPVVGGVAVVLPRGLPAPLCVLAADTGWVSELK